MVERGRLQLLPRPTGVESAVVQLGGKKTLRAAYPRDGREANRLHLDGSRCASHSRLSGGRCGIITRYYRRRSSTGKSHRCWRPLRPQSKGCASASTREDSRLRWNALCPIGSTSALWTDARK